MWRKSAKNRGLISEKASSLEVRGDRDRHDWVNRFEAVTVKRVYQWYGGKGEDLNRSFWLKIDRRDLSLSLMINNCFLIIIFVLKYL